MQARIMNSDFRLGSTSVPRNFQLFPTSTGGAEGNSNFDLPSKSKEFNPLPYPSFEKMIRLKKPTGDSIFTASLITLSVLNLADYFSTREALKYEGFKEANPLMKPFVKQSIAFATIKLGLSVFNYYSMKTIYKKDKKFAWVVSLVSNFIVSYAVWNNVDLIKNSHKK